MIEAVRGRLGSKGVVTSIGGEGIVAPWRLILIRQCLAHGPIDIALCHAGIVRSAPILDYPEEKWDETLALNLRVAFLVAKAAVRSMVESDGLSGAQTAAGSGARSGRRRP